MDKKYHIVYITTNLITNKKYVGDHSTNDITDTYLGSGRHLKSSIKKYGRKNFKREILEFCESKIDAFNLQEKYINEYDTLSPNGYNISKKGGSCSAKEYSKETIQRKKKFRHTTEAKKKISEGNKGTKQSNAHIKKRISPHIGAKRSNTTKANISAALKGKPTWNNNKKTGPLSETHKLKISNTMKSIGRKQIFKICEHCGKSVQQLNYGRWHGDKCKNNINE